MSNMSYCRFENTLNDLEDCFSNMDDSGLSSFEEKARNRLIKLACDIAIDYCHELDLIIEVTEEED